MLIKLISLINECCHIFHYCTHFELSAGNYTSETLQATIIKGFPFCFDLELNSLYTQTACSWKHRREDS